MALRLALLFVVAVGAATQVAHADARMRVAVLGIEVSGTADQRSTALAHELTEGMRARARIGNGPYAYAPSSERELIDQKIISMCDSEAPGCMSAIGKSLGAEVVVYGRLEKQGSGYRLQLHLLDATKKKKLNRISLSVPLKVSSDDARASAKKAYDELAGEIAPSGGTVEIVANVDEGTIYVDDTSTEALRDGKATLSLPEGRYVISVEAPGMQRKEIKVTVKSNSTIEQEFDLIASASAAPTSSRPGQRVGSAEKAFKYTFIISASATGAVLLFTLIDLVRWRGKIGELHATRGDDTTTMLDESSSSYQITASECDGPSVSQYVISDPGNALADLCSTRDRQITTAWLTVGLGTVAIASGIGWYVTHRSKKREARESVSVTPTLSTTSAGALVELRW